MKLTRATSYALHAVVFMATQKQNPIVASHHIAKARGIPERFLLKVLKPLVSARVLFSVKGPNGGYRLAKQPTQITLLEILEAVDGPIRGVVPPVQNDASKLDPKLEVVCNEIADRVRKQLGKVRVSELMGG
jgi:Rrf2 family protein